MTNAPTVGSPAPDLDLTTIDGGRFRLADQVGRAVIVSFLRHAG
ncbi:MAG TPA: hypothetical protein VHF25_13240 [Nitriliruptorales bacterium]|nr:hypothetical protein [Nitriliruptorales bacterium]